MLEVRLLGQYKVILDGDTIEFASRPAQSLFAYLILNPGTEHRREKLAGLFWPDSSEANARNNLRQALWRVRKALQEDEEAVGGFIHADSFSLALNPQSEYWLDASVLDRDLPEEGSREDWIGIVSLYEGELLPGFYEDWVALERERMQASFERKMQLLMERLVREKCWQDVLEWGERWIALGQVPELAYRSLMIAHGCLGNSSNVASVYQRCKDSLETELGVEPSEDTKITYERLSAGEKVTWLYISEEEAISRELQVAQAIPEPHFPDFLNQPIPRGAESETTFVAREHELNQLDAFFQDMIKGRGKVVFVTGDAGSGKTALIHEFARRAQFAYPELLVTLGDCNALTEIGDPYLPFREALGLLTGNLESKWSRGVLPFDQARRLWVNLPLAIQAITEQGPDLLNSFIDGRGVLALGKVYNPEKVGWLEPFEKLIERKFAPLGMMAPEQKDLFSQYTNVFLALARQQPILLLLDDLQWADLGSISLIFHLGRRIEESRVMILGAYRPSEVVSTSKGVPHPLGKVVAEFKRSFGDIQVDLESVGQDEGQYFVQALLDTESNQLGETFREMLYRRTGGHPLFTIELLRAMEERGDLIKGRDGRWEEGPSLDWERLPARVEGVVEERIGRLNPDLQKLLTVASVEGDEFTAEVLAGVLGLDVKDVLDDLSSELDKRYRLVLAQGIRRLGQQRISIYRFRHTLFAMHLYQQLDPVERANLHEEIGTLLERLYGNLVDDIAVALARHFDEAGILERAVTYFECAGNRAKQLSADDDAISHFNKGIDRLQSMPETPERAQRELGLQIALGAPLITTRGYGAPEVQKAFSRARELSLLVLNPSHLFPLIYGLRTFYLMRAEHNTAREIAYQLVALAEQEQDSSFFLQAHEALGSTLFYLGELSLARAHLEKGIALYNAQEHQVHAFLYGQDPGVACRSYLGLTLWCLGFPDQALKWIEDALFLARKSDHPFSLALALDFTAFFFVLCRDVDSARLHAEEAIAISEKHNFPLWLAMGKILLGWTRGQQGAIREGIGMLREGLDAWQGIGAILGVPNYWGLLADLLGRDGQIEAGLEMVSKAIETIQTTSERVNEAELYRLQGELFRIRGADTDTVETSFHYALGIARQQEAKGQELRAALSLCQYSLERDHPEKTLPLLSEIYQQFTEGGETKDLQAAKAILESTS